MNFWIKKKNDDDEILKMGNIYEIIRKKNSRNKVKFLGPTFYESNKPIMNDRWNCLNFFFFCSLHFDCHRLSYSFGIKLAFNLSFSHLLFVHHQAC